MTVSRERNLIFYEDLFNMSYSPDSFIPLLEEYLKCGFPIDFAPDIKINSEAFYVIDNKLPSTPLLYVAASTQCDAKIVKALLDNGADPNILVGPWRQNALLYAACNRDHDDIKTKVDVIEILANKVAEVDLADKYGNTALYYVAQDYHLTKNPEFRRSIVTLVRCGADLNNIGKGKNLEEDFRNQLMRLVVQATQTHEELTSTSESGFVYEL